MNNEKKAQEILDCENCRKQLFIGGVKCPPTCTDYNDLMKMAQWKDEQLKQTREDAKSLYDKISDCIDRLVKSRLSKNGIGESNALQQMESIMVKTQQFLQTI